MVSREHITYLLDAAMAHKITRGRLYARGLDLRAGDFTKATEIGQILWDENRKSIEHRYPDTVEDFSNAPGPIGESYEYEYRPLFGLRPHGNDLDPVQVLKAIKCYEYQSCEHDGWANSAAWHFCQALQSHAISVLPGYDEAEWGSADVENAPECWATLTPAP